MASRIEIYWDGTAPGLASHRLSLNTFAPSLDRLRKAIKSIASGLVAAAVGDAPGPGPGRLARTSVIDLQIAIADMQKGSLTTPYEVETLDPQVLMFMPDLTARASEELVRAISAESQGHLRNRHVRDYLKSLPPTVTRQRYRAIDDGRELVAVEIGEVRLSEVPELPPQLLRVVGEVIGLGLEPGKLEIRFRSTEGTVAASATEAQIEQVLDLRRDAVQALVVAHGGAHRVLWIRPADAPFPVLSESLSADMVLEQWDEVLRRLAK